MAWPDYIIYFMSRAKKSNTREPFDFYSTPTWCVHRLLEKVQFPSAGYWLEPSAGNGAIVKAIHSFKGNRVFNSPLPSNIHVVEIQEQLKEDLQALTPNVYVGDFLKYDFTKISATGQKAEVCIGNPPYNQALPIIQHALKQANTVCMLLRINFLSSEKRAAWMQANVPDLYVLPNRPKFKNNASDACEYGWFTWSACSTGKITILDVTPKDQRKSG